MKAELITKQEFKPVTIQVTFETERELNLALSFIANISGNEIKEFANRNDYGIIYDCVEGSLFSHTLYSVLKDVNK